MPQGRLEGKSVIMFGAGRGIGRGCALAAAEEGAAVTVADFGRLDGIVNLAYGNQRRAPLEDTDPDAVRRELEVSIVGMLSTMQLGYPHLRERGGSIVNFSSGAASDGTPWMAGYAASKAGIRAMSHVAARATATPRTTSATRSPSC